MAVVTEMLSLGRVGPEDVLYDLGSGDGRIPIVAAQRFGTRGVGFEIEPQLVMRSRANAAAAGVDSLVRFATQDLFTADLGGASVVTLYLSPDVNLELRPKLLRELAPGSRVVSHAFHMGDWAPDSISHVGSGFGGATLHLWVVPADVDGFWQLVIEMPRGEQRYALEFTQRYQMLAGAARQGAASLPLEEGRLKGELITFTLQAVSGQQSIRHQFTGRLAGSVLQGTYISSDRAGKYRWRATRFSR
jgi:hypothetical protein